ncbi:MAG: RNA polymerase sigma factor, partial [Gemmatimonadales bacterium]
LDLRSIRDIRKSGRHDTDVADCDARHVSRSLRPSGGLVREVRDERALVRQCREGSESAYAELVRSHRPRLYLLAYRLTGDRETAEDVVQETFLAAFRSIEKVDPRPSLNPWLNTIVLRTAGRAASRARSRVGTSLDRAIAHGAGEQNVIGTGIGEGLIETDPGADPYAAAVAAELRRDLAAALIELPFKYRAAVVLRHVMGLDYAEAARELDIPLNTFKSHLLRGTKMLREALMDSLELESASRASAMAFAEVNHAASDGNGRHPSEVRVGAEQPIRR